MTAVNLLADDAYLDRKYLHGVYGFSTSKEEDPEPYQAG
jgi:hypothetical protein